MSRRRGTPAREKVTLAEYCDRLYELAMGWLGWPDEATMNASIPRIELAVRGRIDFSRKTNPFGGGEAEKPDLKKVSMAAKDRFAAYAAKGAG